MAIIAQSPQQPQAAPAGATGAARAGGALSRRAWTALAVVVLAAAGTAAYHNSLSGPFVLDDVITIRDNADLRASWPPWRILYSRTYWTRPVAGLTVALNYAAGGLDVRGYHAVNLAIHVLAGLTLLGLVRRSLWTPGLRARFGRDADALALAVALRPDVAQAYNNRGSVLLERGRTDEAVRDFTRAIDLAPNGADAYYNRAVARKVQGRLDEAIADCTRAVGLRPRLAVAYHLRAVCRLARKEYDAAWADVRAVRSLGAAPAPELLRDLSAASGRSE